MSMRMHKQAAAAQLSSFSLILNGMWLIVPCPVFVCSSLQECKKVLEEKFKSGKNRWFFTKLRF